MRDGDAMPSPAYSSKELQTAVAMNIQGDGENGQFPIVRSGISSGIPSFLIVNAGKRSGPVPPGPIIAIIVA